MMASFFELYDFKTIFLMYFVIEKVNLIVL